MTQITSLNMNLLFVIETMIQSDKEETNEAEVNKERDSKTKETKLKEEEGGNGSEVKIPLLEGEANVETEAPGEKR